MYTPMMTPSILGRGMLPYIPNSRPPSSRRIKTSSDADGESLSQSTSKSSEASSDGEPSSPTCQHAPLKSVRPAQAAAVGPDLDHYQHHHHQRRTQRRSKKQHHDEEAATRCSSGSINSYSNINHINRTGRCTDTLAAASPSTGAVSSSHAKTTPPRPQHNNHHHHQHTQKACLSASSPPLPPASSPKHVAHHGALKRASHSFISRGKHNHQHNHHPDSHHPLMPDSKHAHAHVRHSSSWSPRSPAAAYMNGAASPSAHDISSRSAAASAMSSSADTSSSSRENLLTSKPFVLRNGRAYLNDTSLPYPLPADLTELHRQSMRTLLLIQVFGGPVCSPVFSKRPPRRVLEVGCGSGFWSMMCHRYFKSRGHGNIPLPASTLPRSPRTPATRPLLVQQGVPPLTPPSPIPK
ncbi:hypothetical protein BBAD15_g6980 [Beauveria bassiana D1-5]|uniref:Uncharacterized protein n=1 Tax=Beauveria bassiana D1-5 TaxID=1245745 RepID=A0A0A2VIM9_BEABA|nr:hypothetical protein BBAD15_g6980 [Beauveria bassiana D1-5]